MSLIWDEINDAKTLVGYLREGLRRNKPIYAETVVDKYYRAEYWQGELKKFLKSSYLSRRITL